MAENNTDSYMSDRLQCGGSEDCDRVPVHKIVTATVTEPDPYGAGLDVEKSEKTVCDAHLQIALEWAEESANHHISVGDAETGR
jgi:hypothetical protein